MIAIARPVTLKNLFFALAFCFTSLQIITGGRPMAAPTAAEYYNTSSVGGEPDEVAIAPMQYSARGLGYGKNN